MRKTFSFFVCIFCLIAVPVVRADYNVNINDNVSGEKSLCSLFNEYFGLTGDDAYKSSNDLFAARGVSTSISSWTVGSDAEVYAIFRNAGYTHEVYSTDLNGNRITGDNGFNMMFDQSSNISSLSDMVGQGLDIPEGVFSWAMDVYTSGDVSSIDGNPDMSWFASGDLNSDDAMHLIAIDVSDFLSDLYGDTVNAYLFAWEDKIASQADWDFQDFVYIMVDVQPTATATPEPGTMLIFGAALLGGLPFAWRRKRYKENEE